MKVFFYSVAFISPWKSGYSFICANVHLYKYLRHQTVDKQALHMPIIRFQVLRWAKISGFYSYL